MTPYTKRSLRCLLALLGIAALVPQRAGAEIRDLVSEPPDTLVHGTQGNESSEHYGPGAFSEDDRYVVFDSYSDNLVAGDENHMVDVYVKDRATGQVTLVSRAGAVAANADSFEGTLSGDGRFVAFTSEASNLVAGDTNDDDDIFVYDRATLGVERVSVGPGGVQADGGSFQPAMSRDGRFVVFLSEATNFVGGDTNAVVDVFVRDRLLATTERVSVGAGGVQSNDDAVHAAIDGGGTRICFVTGASNLVPGDTNGKRDVFVRDRVPSTTSLVTRTPGGVPGNGDSDRCTIATTSGTIAFDSAATDLVAAANANAARDVFVLEAGVITRIDAAGAPGNAATTEPTLSADGRIVAFVSQATNLPGPHAANQREVYAYDRTLGSAKRLSRTLVGATAPGADSIHAIASPSGNLVMYLALSGDQVAGDTNFRGEPLVFRLADDTVERVATAPVPLPSGGAGTTGALSADGRWIAFVSRSVLLGAAATNTRAQVYLFDSTTRTLVQVSRTPSGGPGNGDSFGPQVSADGRHVVYVSTSTDLVALADANNAADAFLYDRVTGTTTRVSTDGAGNAANFGIDLVTISPDGSRIGLLTSATNLTANDATAGRRALVVDRGATSFVRADRAADGTLPNGSVTSSAAFLDFSADGRYVAFASLATNLVAGDANGVVDVFRKDLTNGAVVLASRRSDGGASNGNSDQPTMSADGRYIAYRSAATNLGAGDTSTTPDVYLTDLVGGTTTWVTGGESAATIEAGSPSISGDGRFVAFVTRRAYDGPADTNGRDDVYVFDAKGGVITRMSRAPDGAGYDAASNRAALSENGAWLVFDVKASVVDVAGRENSAKEADVYKSLNPAGDVIFASSFDPHTRQ